MTKHPLGEEPFPKVQRELHLAQYQPVPSGPILGHLREEISSSSSPVPLEEGAGEEDTLSLLRLEKPSDLGCSSCLALEAFHHLGLSSPLDTIQDLYFLLLLRHPKLLQDLR